ncbi:MAG: hypothetical protein IPG69_17800 [Flavobacteriales bacterium]|nr:hypothetical protein [Flavobacteriales bacterium]
MDLHLTSVAERPQEPQGEFIPKGTGKSCAWAMDRSGSASACEAPSTVTEMSSLPLLPMKRLYSSMGQRRLGTHHAWLILKEVSAGVSSDTLVGPGPCAEHIGRCRTASPGCRWHPAYGV